MLSCCIETTDPDYKGYRVVVWAPRGLPAEAAGLLGVFIANLARGATVLIGAGEQEGWAWGLQAHPDYPTGTVDTWEEISALVRVVGDTLRVFESSMPEVCGRYLKHGEMPPPPPTRPEQIKHQGDIKWS